MRLEALPGVGFCSVVIVNDFEETDPAAQTAPEESGIARASLVVGIVALILSLFFIDGIFGVAGLILGVLHLLKRRSGRGLAWTGIALSVAAIFISVALAVVTLRLPGTSNASLGPLRDWEGVAAPDISLTTRRIYLRLSVSICAFSSVQVRKDFRLRL